MQKRMTPKVLMQAAGLMRLARNLSVVWFVAALAAALAPAQQSLPGLVPKGGTVMSGGGGTGRSSSVPKVSGPVGGGTGSLSNLTGATSVGSLTDAPIYAGETVHVLVFDAPDFSIVGEVSDGGDIAVPMAGVVHIAGLNSQTAGEAIADRLKSMDLVTNPQVAVTVDTQALGITILGEVRSPGIYQPMGKSMLSDLLAMAGGITSDSGRVVEISNGSAPDKKVELPWDPTMHNTANYDTVLKPGDRVIIRPCGIAYVGGNVGKPGAYPLCASQVTTLSEVLDMAGGVQRFTSSAHTYVIRTRPDGTRVVMQVNVSRIERAKDADLPIQDDDIVFVSPSSLKLVLTQALAWAVSISGPLIYAYH